MSSGDLSIYFFTFVQRKEADGARFEDDGLGLDKDMLSAYLVLTSHFTGD
jgi:hypothetical protein